MFGRHSFLNRIRCSRRTRELAHGAMYRPGLMLTSHMRKIVVALLSVVVGTTAFAMNKRPPAYSADVVVIEKSKTTHAHVWSDGTHVRQLSADGKSGNYTDFDSKLAWIYGPQLACLQIPMEPEGAKETSREEAAGTETIDGHLAKKVKVTSTLVYHGTHTSEFTEWRATDLHDLVIRRITKTKDGDSEMRLEHIVAGTPDAKKLDFASMPCKYDPVADTRAQAAQAPGGLRKITFFDAACKLLVPLPLTMSIPSDYAIPKAPGSNCLIRTEEDLGKVIAPKGADFTAIPPGVFWVRTSGSTRYNARSKMFVSEDGPQDKWPEAMKKVRAKDIAITSQVVGGIPTTRVTAKVNGQSVYMLYIAARNDPDTPAVLINYHPPAKGAPKDDEEWTRFLASIAKQQ